MITIDESNTKSVDWTTGWMIGIPLAAVVASVLQIASGETTYGFFTTVVFVMICSVAAPVDALTRRIPNALTYPAILIAVVCSLLATGLSSIGAEEARIWIGSPGLLESLLGLVACGGIAVVGFTTAGLGGGDVKLLGAAGAALGLEDALGVMGNALLFAAVIALINIMVRGRLMATAQSIGLTLFGWAIGSRRGRAVRGTSDVIPLAPAILLGLVVSPWFLAHELLWETVPWA